MSQAKDSNERHAVRRAFLRRDPRILYPLRRLLDPPERLIGPYIKPGMVAADLACAWGFYTFAMAERLGPEGKVYAVDLGAKCIRSIQKKAEKASYHNIEAHAASAAKMPFIPDRSVDFVLANGLLCSMENDRPQAWACRRPSAWWTRRNGNASWPASKWKQGEASRNCGRWYP
jgi:2-polyprenyl-3-methyl-5-hydroxy-6-metoxy-1,4-benzoquinol methylase